MPFAPLKIEPFGPLRVAGIRRRHYFDGDLYKVSEQVRGQWRDLARMIWRIPKRGPKHGYSVALYARDAMKALDFFCGFAVADDWAGTAGIEMLDVAAINTAIFEHREHISLVPATIGRAMRSELPAAGLCPDDKNPIAFLMRTMSGFNPLTGNGGVEVMVPVKLH